MVQIMNILILGISGMLGNAMFRLMSADSEHRVHGTTRGRSALRHFSADLSERILFDVDVENHDSLVRVFGITRPDVVVNCIGIVKQLENSKDPLLAVPINSLLPHRLAALCNAADARLIHISTDCVFSGSKGNYIEADFPDASDLYGRTKLLGEVDYPNAITLRTSIIGHELIGQRSLLCWFLAQEKVAKGFTRAIFSGLTTVELAKVIRDFVLPRPDLHGLFHVAATPINKYDLLCLIAQTYQKKIEIVADDSLVIDRSLNAARFSQFTGYIAPPWSQLIEQMRTFG